MSRAKLESYHSAALSIGPVEWGATAAKSPEEHGHDASNSVRSTAEHFRQEDLQPMNGLYAEGSDIVICHTGTSPNSGIHAQILAALWNGFIREAEAQISDEGTDQ